MSMPGVMSVLRERLHCLATGDDGVALALALAFFMPAFMLAVGIYAVQETLWRKVQLQNAADAAAYSASVVQADYLNRIALVNKVLGWTYIDRERARMDYTMGHLVCRAEETKDAEFKACKKENDRSCCSKRKTAWKEYGVGRTTKKALFNTVVTCDAYPWVNGLKNLRFQDFQQFVNSRCPSGSNKFFTGLEQRIRTDGERMKLCNKTLERLQQEMDVAVERAANDILELNMDQSGERWFSQVFTPKTGVSHGDKGKTILARLECSAEDEKNLFEAAGFESADPKTVLGPGADKWLVLANSGRLEFNGPSELGRNKEYVRCLPDTTTAILIAVYLYVAPKWLRWETFLTLVYNEVKQHPLDDKFKKTRYRTGAFTVPMGQSKGVGPNRVLDFGPKGNTYLSGDIDFFWKRWAKASWWFFGSHHACIPPIKLLDWDIARIGCHCWGSTRFSVYENGKKGVKGMRGGQPAYGEVVPANGLKLTDEFFSEHGATRIFVARENANPLRVFGKPSTASKYSIIEEIRKVILRFDAEGLFGVFNSHLGNAGFDKDGTFDGPQRPNYMYALSASRVGYRVPGRKDYSVRQAKPAKRGAKYAWNLCCADWEAFLVPFRSVKMSGWEKASGTLRKPDGKISSWISFEMEMRGLDVLKGGQGWIEHEPKFDGNGRVEGYRKSTLLKSVEGLVTLLRLNDTRGPHPFKSGFTALLWGQAEDYIQH